MADEYTLTIMLIKYAFTTFVGFTLHTNFGDRVVNDKGKISKTMFGILNPCRENVVDSIWWKLQTIFNFIPVTELRI